MKETYHDRFQFLQLEVEVKLGTQVVRSDSASVLVPAIDLEIPATGQKGEVWPEFKTYHLQNIDNLTGDYPGGSSAAHNLWLESRPGDSASSPPRGRRED